MPTPFDLLLIVLGSVVEAKAQLVGIHERVRSDMGGNQPASSVSITIQGAKRVATATNPNAEDAAELLRCNFFFFFNTYLRW